MALIDIPTIAASFFIVGQAIAAPTASSCLETKFGEDGSITFGNRCDQTIVVEHCAEAVNSRLSCDVQSTAQTIFVLPGVPKLVIESVITYSKWHWAACFINKRPTIEYRIGLPFQCKGDK